MSQTLIVDDGVTVLKIFPSESELCDIRTNIPCPVSGCSNIFKSSSNLTMHLEKYHKLTEPNQSSLEKKNDKIMYQYYCPAKFCQYHTDFKLNKKKIYFHQLKYLKQHFLKVHCEKRFVCVSCDKTFSIESALKRHQVECGTKYKCSCGQAYSSRHNLRLHAVRKNHTVNEECKRLKLCPVPILKAPSAQILPKPVITEYSALKTGVISNSHLLEPIKLAERKSIVHLPSGMLKEKRITPILKKKTDLGSLVKRKIVLKKFQNAKKLMEGPEIEFSGFKKEKVIDVSGVANLASFKNEPSFGLESNFNSTNESVKTFEESISTSWSKSDASEPTTEYSRTNINLNELNTFGKTNPQAGVVFDNFEFSNSPKLSQSTQTNEPFLSSIMTTQTDCDITFDDSNLCYYDSFEFSNSPKLSQSTQTFQSSSQVSQTDIQSSFFDDSSNNLSEFAGYYDNFETSNSPKLSQSTQTISHSLCSWSDNVTQTDLDDELFGDSSIVQLDECYRNESLSSCDVVSNNHFSIKEAHSMARVSDETVSTQTAWSAVLQDDRHTNSRSLLDALTTSETQTDSSESSLACFKAQSFSSTQTQTSTSFNYLIDSETQTQELLNQLIDIQTQTYVSNSSHN